MWILRLVSCCPVLFLHILRETGAAAGPKKRFGRRAGGMGCGQ